MDSWKITAPIERIRTQEFTHIAVTGARNIGKTTFINEIIGREVWEAGTLDEDEKPLRISFEPVQEDENLSVADKKILSQYSACLSETVPVDLLNFCKDSEPEFFSWLNEQSFPLTTL